MKYLKTLGILVVVIVGVVSMFGSQPAPRKNRANIYFFLCSTSSRMPEPRNSIGSGKL